jgi:hypothetical protein
VLSAIGVMTPMRASAADSGMVVAIDMAHGGFHSKDVKFFEGNLTAWGFTPKNLTDAFTATSLSDVDVLIVFPPNVNSTFQYTDAELTAVKDWFNTGNKGIWATGDSDFSDSEGKVAAGLNALLESVNSQVLTEQGSVESDLQAGDGSNPYRVRAPNYNNDSYVETNFLSGANNHMAMFHGPAPLIGVKGDSYVALEGDESYFKDHNVFWVVKAVNNETFASTNARASADGLKYQVHDSSSHAEFVMFTAERYAGEKKNSKIVVTSEAIMSDYKGMFTDHDEKNNPTDNNVLVKNTMTWFSTTENAPTPGFEFAILFMAIVPLVILNKKRRTN